MYSLLFSGHLIAIINFSIFCSTFTSITSFCVLICFGSFSKSIFWLRKKIKSTGGTRIYQIIKIKIRLHLRRYRVPCITLYNIFDYTTVRNCFQIFFKVLKVRFFIKFCCAMIHFNVNLLFRIIHLLKLWNASHILSTYR